MKFAMSHADSRVGTSLAYRPDACHLFAHTIDPAHHTHFANYHPIPPWVASPAAPTPAAPAAMSSSNPWQTTEVLCAQLAISCSTLFAIKRSGLLKPGRHLAPKNPGCRRSHLLWHLHRCELALRRQP